MSKACSKCNGEGKLWYHSNVKGGVCFSCNGTGIHHKTIRVKIPTTLHYVVGAADEKMLANSKQEAQDLMVEYQECWGEPATYQPKSSFTYQTTKVVA